VCCAGLFAVRREQARTAKSLPAHPALPT
jgi:hypothetical protein